MSSNMFTSSSSGKYKFSGNNKKAAPPPTPAVVIDNSIDYNQIEHKNWDDYEINPQLLRGIYAYGYESPSPIQRKANIPRGLSYG